MRSINSASFTGSYMPFLNASLVASPITNPSRVLLFVNNTGVNVFISWNGVDDHVVLLPGAGFALDETANAVSNAILATVAKTQFYARGVASTGSVYLSTFYAS
jgi:hypothetical protein